jgi:AraC family transcriptional regulator
MGTIEGRFTQSPRKPYGDGLAANYGVHKAAHVVTRVLQHAELAVTELVAENPPLRVSDPIPHQDAYLIGCQLRDRKPFEYLEGERTIGTMSLQAGDTTIRDLRRDPRSMTRGPFHSLLWFVPRTSIQVVVEQVGAHYVDDLHFDPCTAIHDQTIRHLSASMLPALRAPHQVNTLFSDHIAAAFAAHLAGTYGGMKTQPRTPKGRLAPWQERRAKEMLVADLKGITPLAAIADACGLSAGYFARAFRKSTGLAPHAWLLKARVEHAMTLLQQQNLPLSEIALLCGFADQSHFGRVFRLHTGHSPYSWRRLAIA